MALCSSPDHRGLRGKIETYSESLSETADLCEEGDHVGLRGIRQTYSGIVCGWKPLVIEGEKGIG